MRFVADENVPSAVLAELRRLTHDVTSIKETSPGAEDPIVLALAQAEERVVLTCDTDFGELAFRSGLPAACGVVLIRIDWTDPVADNECVVAALTSRASWAGVFAVVERDRLRVRPLPPSASAS